MSESEVRLHSFARNTVPPSSSVGSGKKLGQIRNELFSKHEIISKRAALQELAYIPLACVVRLRRAIQLAGYDTKKQKRRWKSVAHIGGGAYSPGRKACCGVRPTYLERPTYQPKGEECHTLVHTYLGGRGVVHKYLNNNT